VGNTLWLVHFSMGKILLFWIGFPLFIISGERLELSKLVTHGSSTNSFPVFMGVFFIGAVFSIWKLQLGFACAGFGIIGISIWFLRFDIAKISIKKEGLIRYIAICMLSGYFWLGITGIVSLMMKDPFSIYIYDMLIHSFFLGFVFSMIFGHALIIFPADFGRNLPYGPFYYGPLIFLHISLIFRIQANILGWQSGIKWSGLLNVLAILSFLTVLVSFLIRGDPGPKKALS